MDDKKTIEANAQPIVPAEDDNEARIAKLEADKAKLIEEKANYQVAYLKEKAKGDKGEDVDEDERIKNLVNQQIADSRLAEIAREQDEIIRKTLKENKELKLAHLNKKEPPAAMGAHSEGTPVRDTLVTSEQLEAFKARGWSDKDIERYKKNLQKYSGR